MTKRVLRRLEIDVGNAINFGLRARGVPQVFEVYGDAMWGNSASYTAAVYHDGATYCGVSSQADGATVVKYVHATGVTTSFSLNSTVGPSDHSAPTIVVRSDGKLLAMYSEHNDTSGLRYRISTNAADISAWGVEQLLTTGAPSVTYAYVVQLASVMVLFFRNAVNFFYRTSTDQGSTWSGVTWCFTYDAELGRPYPQPLKTADDRIDFLLCQQDAALDLVPIVYHCYATWNGSTLAFKDTAGTAITLPVDAADGDATVVYDGTADYSAFWATLAKHSDGSVWALLKVWNSATNVDYVLVRQTGSTWGAPVVVCSGGYPTAVKFDYVGDACFSPTDTTRIFASVGTASGGPWELARYRTQDSGDTWSKEADITTASGSGVYNFRPAAVTGSGPSKIGFIKGAYTGFTTWDTALWLAS